MFKRFVPVAAAALGFAFMLTVYSLCVLDNMYSAEIAAVGATPDYAISGELMHEQLVAFDLR